MSIIINNNSSRKRSRGRIKIWKYLGPLYNKKQYFSGGLETLFSVVPEHLGSNWWVSLLSTPANIGPEGLQKSWSETSQCGDVSPGLWLKQLSTSSVGQLKWNLVFPFWAMKMACLFSENSCGIFSATRYLVTFKSNSR